MELAMYVQFKIVRQDPNALPRVQKYGLEIEPSATILDCLNQIKWEQDGTLGFRKNCRNTICGSCSIRINGRSALACKENVGSEIARSQLAHPGDPADAVSADEPPVITLAPMGNMPVIRDLIVNMQGFWANLKAVDPYVSTASRQVPEREFLQTPDERSRLNQVGNCILCGACYSECNAVETNSDFVGPHALAKAYRMVADSRDETTEARLEQYNKGTQGVWGCTRCYYCNSVCPMEVAPMEQISKIKSEILERPSHSASRSIRHRRVLIDLVKQGGWINESQFGLKVVGNSFKDIQGLASLAPLGIRMMARRKFPLGFEKSQGTDTVRSLIDSVKQIDRFQQIPFDTLETPEPVGG
jgi:succinate dehydrogenase / fumarate reductase, iron-sulfur subunit